MPARVRHAAAAEFEDFAWLRAGRHLHFFGAFQRGHLNSSSQDGLGITDRDSANEILTIALEERMLLEVDHAVAIARRAAAGAGFPFAGQAHAHVMVDAGGDFYLAEDSFASIAGAF